MSFREEQCKKVCRILDNVLANRPTERDSLIVAVRKAFDAMQPAPDQNGDLWITVPDIDEVTCIYVQESKSKFCRIFYEEQEQPEIIRCKDCRRRGTNLIGNAFCAYHNHTINLDDFCSYAERGEVADGNHN